MPKPSWIHSLWDRNSFYTFQIRLEGRAEKKKKWLNHSSLTHPRAHLHVKTRKKCAATVGCPNPGEFTHFWTAAVFYFPDAEFSLSKNRGPEPYPKSKHGWITRVSRLRGAIFTKKTRMKFAATWRSPKPYEFTHVGTPANFYFLDMAGGVSRIPK